MLLWVYFEYFKLGLPIVTQLGQAWDFKYIILKHLGKTFFKETVSIWRTLVILDLTTKVDLAKSVDTSVISSLNHTHCVTSPQVKSASLDRDRLIEGEFEWQGCWDRLTFGVGSGFLSRLLLSLTECESTSTWVDIGSVRGKKWFYSVVITKLFQISRELRLACLQAKSTSAWNFLTFESTQVGSTPNVTYDSGRHSLTGFGL